MGSGVCYNRTPAWENKLHQRPQGVPEATVVKLLVCQVAKLEEENWNLKERLKMLDTKQKKQQRSEGLTLSDVIKDPLNLSLTRTLVLRRSFLLYLLILSEGPS